jgi:hypothetical protein
MCGTPRERRRRSCSAAPMRSERRMGCSWLLHRCGHDPGWCKRCPAHLLLALRRDSRNKEHTRWRARHALRPAAPPQLGGADADAVARCDDASMTDPLPHAARACLRVGVRVLRQQGQPRTAAPAWSLLVHASSVGAVSPVVQRRLRSDGGHARVQARVQRRAGSQMEKQ